MQVENCTVYRFARLVWRQRIQSAQLLFILSWTAIFLVAGCATPSALSPQAVQGKQLYAQNCASCHGSSGEGQWRSQGILGAPPHNASGHTWDHSDTVLQKIVKNGIFVAGTYVMPPFKDKLSDDEIAAIFSFIKVWWTSEQISGQATLNARLSSPSPK